MCELLASAYAAEAFVTPLAKWFSELYIEPHVATILAIVIVTVILSYFLLIFGGILPKRIARNYPEKTAFRVVSIRWFVAFLNRPFEKIISSSTKFFSKLFHIANEPKEKLTEKEIKMIIREGKDQGVIDNVEKDIFFKALKFNDLHVKDIMLAKEKIDFINLEDSSDKILANIRKYNYTRMPVFQDTKDNVIGFINIKDFIIEYANKKRMNLNVKNYLRPISSVSTKEKVSDVFKRLQLEKQALAIVKNNEQNVVGLITMEDIIETLVGNIIDEYDKA